MISRSSGSAPFQSTVQQSISSQGSVLEGELSGLTASLHWSIGNSSLRMDTQHNSNYFSSPSSSSNVLPLNLLVDAAIGKVSLGGTTATTPIDNGQNGLLQLSTLANLKRGFEPASSPTFLSGFSEQLTNLNRNNANGSSSSPYKKRRVVDNPVLMQRLSTLSGGFPFPNWGAFLKGGKGKSSEITQHAIKVSESLGVPSTSIGAFPMPRAKEKEKLRLLTEKPVLTSFQQVWDREEWSGDSDLQKEVLARKLQKGSFRMDPKPVRHKVIDSA